ncbi:hypothetical protein QE152_g33030 [Popillia japonica]|uniref:Uncharacterized protein n=1 Tax=Popillia japonica TaxID=7064 RepID=A0AAW1IYF0_POPJA
MCALRLHYIKKKLWEEFDEDEDQTDVSDDQEDFNEDDHVEEREENSDSEQELENRILYQPPMKKIKGYRSFLYW